MLNKKHINHSKYDKIKKGITESAQFEFIMSEIFLLLLSIVIQN